MSVYLPGSGEYVLKSSGDVPHVVRFGADREQTKPIAPLDEESFIGAN